MGKEIHDILTHEPEPTKNEAQSNIVEIYDSGEDDDNNSHYTNVVYDMLLIFYVSYLLI